MDFPRFCPSSRHHTPLHILVSAPPRTVPDSAPCSPLRGPGYNPPDIRDRKDRERPVEMVEQADKEPAAGHILPAEMAGTVTPDL